MHRFKQILTLIFTVALAASLLADEPDAKAIARGNLLAPKAFRAAAATIRPCLVSIESFGGVSGEGKKGAGASFRPGEGPTTGVVISSDGYIVTSTFNFLNRPPIITVVFSNGQRKIAKLLGRDDTRKLCLLKIDNVSGLATPEHAPPSELKVGQWAIALGVGFGETEPAITAGIISATNRISGRAIQTDANLSPANYGGPLVDIEGRLIGVCVPLSPGSKDVAAGAEWYDSGIGFAVPLTGLDHVIAQLKEGKTLEQGYLGVQAGPYGDPPSGAEISKVLPGSAAEQAGLKEKDRILKVAGDEVVDVTQLSTLVGKHLLGEVVKLTIKRGEETQEIDVTLGEMPAPPPMPMPMPKKPGDKDKPEKPEDKPEEKKPEEPQPPEDGDVK
jgi:serine protease Do